MNNIEWEDYLIDQDGNNIVFPDRDSLISKPPNLPYTSSDHLNSMSPQGDYRFSLNPKRSRILNQERFFLPDKNQDVIYQCMFFAESIIEPVEKTIKVHYRINEIECNFNELLSIVRDLYEKGNLNDYGVYELIKSNLAQYGKNQA